MDNGRGLFRPLEIGSVGSGGGGDGEGGSRKVGDDARRNLSLAVFAAVPSSSSYGEVIVAVLLSMALHVAKRLTSSASIFRFEEEEFAAAGLCC